MVELAEKEQILHIQVNSDRTVVALGTTLGFQIFSIEPSFMRQIRRTFPGGVRIAELIDTSSLILLVPTGHNPEEGK
jgi:hypothetical protein